MAQENGQSDNNDSATYGVALKRRREAAGLSTRRLARLAGVGDRTINRLEQGTIASPRSATLEAIDAALRQSLPPTLPPLSPYLRAKYPKLPQHVVNAMIDYFEYLTARHGKAVDLRDREDER